MIPPWIENYQKRVAPYQMLPPIEGCGNYAVLEENDNVVAPRVIKTKILPKVLNIPRIQGMKVEFKRDLQIPFAELLYEAE